MGNLPLGLGYSRETGHNTEYDSKAYVLELKLRAIVAPEDEPVAYQLVGEVMAHQGRDG